MGRAFLYNGEKTNEGAVPKMDQRKKRQLERIRQVQRAKRRLAAGGMTMVVLLIGVIMFIRIRSQKTEETGQQDIAGLQVQAVLEMTDDEQDSAAENGVVTADTRAEYLAVMENLCETDERYQQILDHQEEYPDSVLKLCVQNEETLNFVLDYPEKKDLPAEDTVGEVTLGQVPLLLQWDRRWGYAPYGEDGIVAISGCGPTCISMVVCALTGRNDITPANVAAYSEANGFLTADRDTTWDLMTFGCEVYGITGTEIGLDENVMANQLAAGCPIIASVGAGDFTANGHFIVIAAYNGEAFQVNDPNSIERSQRTWTFEELRYQIRNLWAYSLF